jgi:hypothetical protein
MTRHSRLIVAAALISTTATASEPDRCAADIAKAEADLLTAQRKQYEELNPDEFAMAERMVAAAAETLRTVHASCTVVVDKRLAKRLAKWAKLKERKRPKHVVVLEPASEPDPFEPGEPMPPPPRVVPVPGVPWLVDPIVERECPGLLCPIVVIVPPKDSAALSETRTSGQHRQRQDQVLRPPARKENRNGRESRPQQTPILAPADAPADPFAPPGSRQTETPRTTDPFAAPTQQ